MLLCTMHVLCHRALVRCIMYVSASCTRHELMGGHRPWREGHHVWAIRDGITWWYSNTAKEKQVNAMQQDHTTRILCTSGARAFHQLDEIR